MGRWFSARKDAERHKLLQFDKQLMKSTSKVVLISEDSKRLGEMSPQEARKLGEEKGMEVVILKKGSDPQGLITCKLFSRLQLKGADKQMRSKSHHKTIELRSNIDEHDLQIKINKMRQLLGKRHSVNLSVSCKPKRFNSGTSNEGELQRRLINRVCAELNITPGKITVGKANTLTCTLQPKEHSTD